MGKQFRELANYLFMVRLLQLFGFIVQKAQNGQEVIDLWQQWQPDLIFMDIRMLIMSGDQATKYIVNAKTDLKKPIIIALTASVLEEEKTIFLEAGCDDFIRKRMFEKSRKSPETIVFLL